MTKGNPTNIAASVHARLMNLARAEGRSFNDLLQFYAIERFLYRLSRSDHAAKFVLKGALLLRVWDPESPHSFGQPRGFFGVGVQISSARVPAGRRAIAHASPDSLCRRRVGDGGLAERTLDGVRTCNFSQPV